MGKKATVNTMEISCRKLGLRRGSATSPHAMVRRIEIGVW
jgi:hypothetical protein